MDVTRRNFLLSTTAAAAGATLAGQTPGAGAQAPTLAAQAAAHPAPRGFNPADPALKFDIVIANGDVLDPSQKLHGKRDIGVKFGQIAAIASSLPADRAVQRIDAAGKLVTPGLVDLHTHLVPHLGIGLPADELVPITPVMCHIGAAPGSLSDLLDLLRPGDILTHAYSGAGNNTVQNGQLLPAARAAKQRGVIFDVGHGGGSFDYTVCEPALQQGAPPDTISSDIHAVSINTPGYPTLPNVMSKFLNLGMPLEDVVAKATVEPARVIGRVPGLGTPQIGAPADVAIFDLVDAPVEFVDTRQNRRSGTKKLVPVLTVRGGRPFGRPPMPFPFTY